MEGYLPVCQYAYLTGLSKDTILHRANRKQVDCFKNSEGRWFIYYCDDEFVVPKGYLTIADFSKKVKKTRTAIQSYIKKGLIKSSDVLRRKQEMPSAYLGTKPRIFIKEDAKINYPIKYSSSSPIYQMNKQMIYTLNKDKPSSEYLTVHEWADKEGVATHNAYNWISEWVLPCVINNGHKYIHKDYTIDTVAKERTERRNNKKEWLQKKMQEMLK